jgi:hypothetical protein
MIDRRVIRSQNSSTFQADMSIDEERSYLTGVVDTIEKATGRRTAAGSISGTGLLAVLAAARRVGPTRSPPPSAAWADRRGLRE